MPVGLRGLLIAGIFATHGLAQHSDLMRWHEFYPGLVTSLTSIQHRQANKVFAPCAGHDLVLGSDDRSRSTTSPPRHRLPTKCDHSDCRLVFRLYLWLVLGVFSRRHVNQTRGNDFGNIFAMIIGFIIVAILSGLPNKIAGIFGGKLYTQRAGCP